MSAAVPLLPLAERVSARCQQRSRLRGVRPGLPGDSPSPDRVTCCPRGLWILCHVSVQVTLGFFFAVRSVSNRRPGDSTPFCSDGSWKQPHGFCAAPLWFIHMAGPRFQGRTGAFHVPPQPWSEAETQQ